MVTPINKRHPEYGALCHLANDLAEQMAVRLYVRGIAACKYKIKDQIRRTLAGQATGLDLVTAGPCVVGLIVHTPWWSEKAILAEEFILRYKQGNFSDTLKELEAYGKQLGVHALCISTLAAVRQETYIDLLKRKGYRLVSAELMKEL